VTYSVSFTDSSKRNYARYNLFIRSDTQTSSHRSHVTDGATPVYFPALHWTGVHQRTSGVSRHGYQHRMTKPVERTNKMQPCNRIYYSKIYWRLSIFRTAYRSSSGASNCICSLWFIYCPYGDRPLSRLDNGRSPRGQYINQRLKIQFRAPDDEQYAARNMLSFQ